MSNPRFIAFALVLAAAGIVFRLFIAMETSAHTESDILLMMGVAVWSAGGILWSRYAKRRCREQSWSMSRNCQLESRRALGRYALVTGMIGLIVAIVMHVTGV